AFGVEFVGLFGVSRAETRVLPRLARGNDRELPRGVQALGLDLGNELGILDRLGDPAGDVHGQIVLGNPVVGDRLDTGDTLDGVLPRLGCGAADRAECPEAGDYYFLTHLTSF